MEQNDTTTLPSKDSIQNVEKKFKAIAIIVSAFAVFGIGFSIYESVDNSNKVQQIQDLQKQIEQLKASSASPATTGQYTSIKVVSTSWSGWSADYKPEEKVSTCELTLNKKCVVKTIQLSDANGNEWEEEVLSFEVKGITDDSVSIHTFQIFSDQKSGVNLYSNKQDFVIKSDEPLELTTPTMDAGDIFTLSLTAD